MLFSLFSNLVEIFSFLNVFKYLTVRTGLSMFTSMVVVFLVGGPLINYFSTHKKASKNPQFEDMLFHRYFKCVLNQGDPHPPQIKQNQM